MDSALPPFAGESPTGTRRGEILEAAATVFAEKGYQRATVKEIADRAGVAPGTIYLYFKNKRDLLLAIADQLIRQAWAQTQAEMTHTDAESYIGAILQNTFHFVHRNKPLVQALITEIWTDDLLQDRFFEQILDPIFQAGASYLHANIEAGRARPCQVEIVIPTIGGSLIILSMLRALAADQFLADYRDDDLVSELTRLYLYGLRPDLGDNRATHGDSHSPDRVGDG